MPQQGIYQLTLNLADGQPLKFAGSGSPDKLLEFVIPFAKPFNSPPMVHLGVVGISAVGDGDTNWKPTQGFHIRAKEVTAQHVTIDVQVSWYNKAFTVEIGWLALEI